MQEADSIFEGSDQKIDYLSPVKYILQEERNNKVTFKAKDAQGSSFNFGNLCISIDAGFSFSIMKEKGLLIFSDITDLNGLKVSGELFPDGICVSNSFAVSIASLTDPVGTNIQISNISAMPNVLDGMFMNNEEEYQDHYYGIGSERVIIGWNVEDAHQEFPS